MANTAFNPNGIPFLGAVLKFSRPSKYVGAGAAQEKINHEKFVGNTAPEMAEQMLREFLGNAMNHRLDWSW